MKWSEAIAITRLCDCFIPLRYIRNDNLNFGDFSKLGCSLQKSWDSNHNSFMPLPPLSLNDLKWYFEKFFEVFNYPSGLYLTGIAALAFVIGLQFS